MNEIDGKKWVDLTPQEKAQMTLPVSMSKCLICSTQDETAINEALPAGLQVDAWSTETYGPCLGGELLLALDSEYAPAAGILQNLVIQTWPEGENPNGSP